MPRPQEKAGGQRVAAKQGAIRFLLEKAIGFESVVVSQIGWETWFDSRSDRVSSV